MTDSTTTWGISGPHFLALFALVAVAAWLLGLAMRRRLRAGRVPFRELHPYELAYLAGGPRTVVAAVLAALRASGSVAARPGGVLQVVGAPPVMRTPLDDAVLQAVGPGARTRDLTAGHPLLRPRLEELRTSLRGEGLLLAPEERRSVRAAALPLLFVLLLGVARIVAGVQNDRPVGFLIALVVAVAIVLAFLLHVPEETRSVPGVLAAARARHGALRPESSPDWTAYGPSAASLGVALFGIPVLLAMDPEFAAAAEVQQRLGQPASSTGDGGGGGDVGDSGGGDGGGGGCGGGCGGCGG